VAGKKFQNCPAGQAKGQAGLFWGRPGLPGHPPGYATVLSAAPVALSATVFIFIIFFLLSELRKMSTHAIHNFA